MTIGIGATGPRAGLAVFRALQAAERVGKGSIGGFAVFAAIGADGELHRSETQRGGTMTLFTNGEETGGDPPRSVTDARFAAVMSSGPDRPAPLSQFLSCDPGVGLVTGHRLPNTPGTDGHPVNDAVLNAMREGKSAEAALDAVLTANSTVDAGMIALGPNRGLAMRNSDLVAVRPDLGSALRSDFAGASVAVLHNAIRPAEALAALVAEIAMEILCPPPAPAGNVTVESGVPLALGDRNTVEVNAHGVVQRVMVTTPLFLTGRHVCAAIYLGAEVRREGTLLGRTMMEPNVLVEDSRILLMSGQAVFSIPYSADGGGENHR